MSWGTCYTGSNNIHYNSPPLMSDGRNFASWQPGSVLSNNLRVQSGIKSNWDYRQYLISNADSIIKYNQMNACDNCGSCSVSLNSNNTLSNNTPFLYNSTIDKSTPYGYETSDLKKEYLTRHQLQSRMRTPVVSQYQLLRNK